MNFGYSYVILAYYARNVRPIVMGALPFSETAAIIFDNFMAGGYNIYTVVPAFLDHPFSQKKYGLKLKVILKWRIFILKI